MIKNEDQKHEEIETSNSVKFEQCPGSELNRSNVKTECPDQLGDELFGPIDTLTAQIEGKNITMGLIENFISHSVFGSEGQPNNATANNVVENTNAKTQDLLLLPEMGKKMKKQKLHICTECNKIFDKKYSLNRHKLIHSNGRPYVCEVCNRAFAEKHHLREHSRIHSGEKPYVCEVCNTAFAHKSTLRRHRLIHTGEKPYSCTFCEKAFNKKSTLDRHKLVHTGEKPYVCNLCNNQYRHKQSLDQHKLNHHKT